MQNQPWTERGIKGAKYLATGAILILAQDPIRSLAQGNDLAMAAVIFASGVIGPIFVVAGLYLIGTRNKK
jgi:hypothetical protein